MWAGVILPEYASSDQLLMLLVLQHVAMLRGREASYGVPGVWGGQAKPKAQKALNDATERVVARMPMGQQAQGDVDAGLAPLQQALTLAEPEGYVRMFVDEGM